MILELSEVKLIGLTGMSGAGKTTACQVFRKSGFFIVDCDKIAGKILGRNSRCLRELCERFSAEVVSEKGELDRRAVADMIFSDEELKKRYENIVFPYITYAVIETVRHEAAKKREYILLDAPTLFESGMDKFCDCVVSVVTELKTAKERIISRDGITEEEAIKRLRSQKKANYYVERSRYSVINSSDIKNLEDDTEKVINKIRSGGINNDKLW